MKRKLMGFCVTALFCALLSGCGSTPVNNTAGMDLDAAIKEAALETEASFPEGTKVALVSVASSSAQLSEYVISRLESALVGGKKLVVVDRANLDKVRAEQGFQMSGEVDDESAKKIGGLLGAGAIVTGAFTNLGDVYGMTLKAINMETAAVAVSYPADVTKSARIETLLASGGGAAAASGGQAATKPTAPAGPKNGTYTFWPRLRATRAGLPAEAYIPQIIVTSEYIVIFFSRQAEGDFSTGLGNFYIESSYSLQDLDNPSQFYTPTSAQYTDNGMGSVYNVSFKRFPSTRFRLSFRQSNSYNSPLSTFEEIVLGEPDA